MADDVPSAADDAKDHRLAGGSASILRFRPCKETHASPEGSVVHFGLRLLDSGRLYAPVKAFTRIIYVEQLIRFLSNIIIYVHEDNDRFDGRTSEQQQQRRNDGSPRSAARRRKTSSYAQHSIEKRLGADANSAPRSFSYRQLKSFALKRITSSRSTKGGPSRSPISSPFLWSRRFTLRGPRRVLKISTRSRTMQRHILSQDDGNFSQSRKPSGGLR